VKKFMLNLKRQAEENPMVAIGVGTAAVAVATKLVEAAVSTRNSQTWKQEVNRRNRNS
jgi:malic enzyme